MKTLSFFIHSYVVLKLYDRFILVYFSCAHKFKYPLQNVQNVNNWNKIRRIMKIAC